MNFIDINLYAQIGAKLYGTFDGDVDVRFIALIGHRVALTEEIVRTHPEFSPFYDFLLANKDNVDLSSEFNELMKTPELFSDVKFAILAAAYGAFLDRKNPDRQFTNDCITCVERALDNPGAEVVGFPSIAILCVALWFSDYKGYKECVLEQIKKLVAENWYDSEKIIDIDDVRKNIDNSKFN